MLNFSEKNFENSSQIRNYSNLSSINYCLEAESENMRGRVICGSRRGYSGSEEISLDDVGDIVTRLHELRSKKEMPSLSCIVNEGRLVGRTGEDSYRERVYFCDFSHSPRSALLDIENFKEYVRNYACEIGKEFNQTRIYVELESRVEVWKI